MRKIFILMLLFAGCIAACKQEDKTDPETERLNTENQALQHEVSKRDSSINAFLQTFNEIEENLVVIKEREKILEVNTQNPELQRSREKQIVADIELINELLITNREKIASLQGKLSRFGPQIAEMEKMVARLNRQLTEKDAELDSLRTQLATVNENYKTLFDEYNQRIEEVAQKQAELNTAYYAYGTSKELKEQGVITREGGFVGIGRAEKLREDFNRDYFTKIDIEDTQFIDVLSKKAKLITSHPAGSYIIEGTGKNHRLTITNPKEFWSVSKYLVIVTD